MPNPYEGLLWDKANDEVQTWQGDAERERLAREASAARGGTPLHRAWRALVRVLRPGDPSSSDG